MMRRVLFGVAGSLLALPLMWAASPTKMEPTEAHRKLDFLVGEWDVHAKMHLGDRIEEGVHNTRIQWLPGGVWLDESSDLQTPLGPMHGSARIAWDADAQEYVRYWLDNQSVALLPQRGRFTDEHTLELTGSFQWVDGTTFHQRLVIKNDPQGGWRQTGYLGRDPDSLRLNHDSVAIPASAPAAAVPSVSPVPTWLERHMEFLTQGGGLWTADNSAYRSEEEPFDAYRIQWSWGIGRTSITGRLYGIADGMEQGTFWEFRTVWHPGNGEAQAYQYGGSGIVGLGKLESSGDGETRLLQVFHGPDGSSFSVGHKTREKQDKTHVTMTFDVLSDDSWTPRRTYHWRLVEP